MSSILIQQKVTVNGRVGVDRCVVVYLHSAISAKINLDVYSRKAQDIEFVVYMT